MQAGKTAVCSYGVKPEFQTYLNDPSGFFKFRVGIKPWGSRESLEGWRGLCQV